MDCSRQASGRVGLRRELLGKVFVELSIPEGRRVSETDHLRRASGEIERRHNQVGNISADGDIPRGPHANDVVENRRNWCLVFRVRVLGVSMLGSTEHALPVHSSRFIQLLVENIRLPIQPCIILHPRRAWRWPDGTT